MMFPTVPFFSFFFLFGVMLSLNVKQKTGEKIGEVRAVSDMHQRKAEMVRQADAFIALPGMTSTVISLREV